MSIDNVITTGGTYNPADPSSPIANVVIGPVGPRGYPGMPGANGVSINAVYIANGYLNVQFSNSLVANAGYIGNTLSSGNGIVGANGATGVGIAAAYIANGILAFTYTNAAVANVGYVVGPQGNTGVQGPTGPQGNAGVSGSNGVGIANSYVSNGILYFTLTDNSISNAGSVIGPQGLQGNVGAVGATGPAGTPGAQGLAGVGIEDVFISNGFLNLRYTSNVVANAGSVIGPQGPAGANGAQGPSGLTGPVGPQGNAGVNGTNGLNGTNGVGVASTYINNGYLNVIYTNSVIANAGMVQGAQGPQGIQGPIGPQGPIGNTGAQGPMGFVGPTGPQGPIGNTGVGIVSTTISNGYLNITYTNAVVANAGSVAGPQGPQGIQGVDGPIGNTGTGIASAFLSNGFLNIAYTNAAVANVGLVQGPQGIQGPAGATGATGATGAAGQSIVGPQGPIGNTGATGATGTQGPQGIQGPIGNTGATGDMGPQGNAGVSVSNVAIANTNHLIFTLSDNSAVDAGLLPFANGMTDLSTGEVFNPPLTTYFPTNFNANSVNISTTYSTQYGFNINTTNSVANASAFVAKAVTNFSWQIVARMRIEVTETILGGPNNYCGIILYDSANEKSIVFGKNSFTYATNNIVAINPENDFFGEDRANEWFKVSFDGTNYNFFVSQEGYFWRPVFTQAATSYLGAATHVGLGFLQQNTGNNYQGITVPYWSDNA